MQRLITGLLAAGLIASWAVCPAPAQELAGAAADNTVAVVSVSGYDAAKKDVELVAGMLGFQDQIKGLDAVLNMATGGQGIPGLDTTKPIGVVVQIAGPQPGGYAFVPVSDVDALLKFVAGMAQQPPPEAEDGVYTIQQQGQSVFVTQKGSWAFLTNTRETLDTVPADPVAQLGGLESQYTVAARVFVQKIPKELRQGALAGAEAGAPVPGKLAQSGMEEATAMLDGLDTVTVGLKADEAAKALVLDVSVRAVPGSEAADALAAMANPTTNLAGFVAPDAAVAMRMSGQLSESAAAELKASIGQIRDDALAEIDNEDLSEAEAALSKQMLGDLFGVLEATVSSRRIDLAAAVDGNDTGALLLGSYVADGAKLGDLIKQAANLAVKTVPELAQAIKVDAGEHAGVRYHTLTVPAEAMGPGAPPALAGKSVTLILGTSGDAVYVAAGVNPLERLTAALDASQSQAGAAVGPLQLTVGTAGVKNLVDKYVIQPATAAGTVQRGRGPEFVAAVEAAGALGGHLTLAATPAQDGMDVSLSIGEGMLQMLAALAPRPIKEESGETTPSEGGFPGEAPGEFGGFPGEPGEDAGGLPGFGEPDMPAEEGPGEALPGLGEPAEEEPAGEAPAGAAPAEEPDDDPFGLGDSPF